MSLPIVSITNSDSPYSLNVAHHTIICNMTSGNIRINLPVNSISVSGRIYILKQYPVSSSYTLTIDPNTSNIDMNSGLRTISSSLPFIKLQSDSTNWWIIG
jgi:hypothetical protein